MRTMNRLFVKVSECVRDILVRLKITKKMFFFFLCIVFETVPGFFYGKNFPAGYVSGRKRKIAPILCVPIYIYRAIQPQENEHFRKSCESGFITLATITVFLIISYKTK